MKQTVHSGENIKRINYYYAKKNAFELERW
jgi:hypothetical protein